MSYENLLPAGITPLTENIIYDDEVKEVVIRIGRVHVGLTVEEFAVISKEIEEASKMIYKVLLNKVQNNNSEEIN